MNLHFLQRLIGAKGERSVIIGLRSLVGSQLGHRGPRPEEMDHEIEHLLAKRGASYYCDPEPTTMFTSPLASSLPDGGEPRNGSADASGEIGEGVTSPIPVRTRPVSQAGSWYRDPEPTGAFELSTFSDHRGIDTKGEGSG